MINIGSMKVSIIKLSLNHLYKIKIGLVVQVFVGDCLSNLFNRLHFHAINLVTSFKIYRDSNRPMIFSCQLQKHTAASNSDDFLDIKALPANVLDSYDQSSRGEVLNEQSSLEAFILNDLEMVIGQFTEKTRICFRDALYRLARNNEQQHSVQDQEKGVDIKNHIQTTRSQEKIPMESETNCVDRVIANLMFNKMEYNMHGLPMMTSTVSSEQEASHSNGLCSKNSTASKPAQKFHYPNHQKLARDGEVPWFEISNQQKDMTSSHIEFGHPMKKSFMLEFG
ncbi:hypothetical protein PIB30_020463 [Stylosanthes scabra]|uniref:Uncharacterized protein n=1 Tax=Stylosanthes scabra TaxID=79078 RepID=A0ABU6V7Y4_9FABA|nr:hypothetical protein [Stylosanthes scabra]